MNKAATKLQKIHHLVNYNDIHNKMWPLRFSDNWGSDSRDSTVLSMRFYVKFYAAYAPTCTCSDKYYVHLNFISNFELLLVHITWSPANWIAWNVSPDGALNHVKHTLPCVKFLNAWQSSDSQTQECEGYALSFLMHGKAATVGHKNAKVTRQALNHLGHMLLGITRFLTHSGKANNGLNRG